MATDYDKAKVTDREKEAAKNQNQLGDYGQKTLKNAYKYNTKTLKNTANWGVEQATSNEKLNAKNTTTNQRKAAENSYQQLQNQLTEYNMADRQNAAMRNNQFGQTSTKSEAERFDAQRNLRNAALGLFGSMNQAMNGSTLGNVMSMLYDRNDADNSTYWQQLQENRNAIQNAYDESANQNQISRYDAMTNALKALGDEQVSLSGELNTIQNNLYSQLINNRSDLMTNLANAKADYYTNQRNAKADLAANLNNINPKLYEKPGKVSTLTKADINNGMAALTNKGVGKIPTATKKNGTLKNTIYSANDSKIAEYEKLVKNLMNKTTAHTPTDLGYIMPAKSDYMARRNRNTVGGNDYFSRLMNGFTG